jgi:hypothetical protein
MTKTTAIVRSCTRYACLAICLAIIAALMACSTPGAVDNTVGIGTDDNAIQCIHANVDGYFTDSGIVTNRIEFPKELNLGTLTPELITALTELAEKMGCTR